MNCVNWQPLLVLPAALLGLPGCDNDKPPASPAHSAPPAAAPSTTASASATTEAVALNQPGLPNAYRVSPDLYRGAQPASEGFKALERLGIKTVVNLRLTHSDRDEIEQSGVAQDGFDYVHIPMEAWDADEDEIVEFLRIVTDPSRTPVFVHCAHGADRTGTMVATYRIVVQGWAKERAIEEMTRGPFGFHEIWKGLPRFLREMDPAQLKAKAAAPKP